MRRIFVLAILASLLFSSAPSSDSFAQNKAQSKKLRFVVYGDTRDGHAIHKKLVALILKQKPDFVIQTGDLVTDANDPAQWKIYDDITADMRKKLPVYPVRGNHDVGAGYLARFTSPISSGTRLHYSFDRADCHFIGLDTCSEVSKDGEQYVWLEKDLEAASAKSKRIFVSFHVPPYGIGWMHSTNQLGCGRSGAHASSGNSGHFGGVIRPHALDLGTCSPVFPPTSLN